MIRKILCIIMCFTLMCSLRVFAVETSKPEVKLISANSDMISVFGSAPAGTGVVITVLNVGYDKTDLKYNNHSEMTQAVAYTAAQVTKSDNTYRFDVKLRDNGKNPDFGGIFNIIVTVGTTEYIIPFEFYYYDKKIEVIKKFNEPGDLKLVDILEEAIKYYSFAQNILWTDGNSEKAIEALLNIQKECEGDYFPEDPDVFYDYLETSLLISAINAGKTSILLDDEGYFREELLARLPEDGVEDYKNHLSKKGVSLLNNDIFSEKYNIIDDVSEYFYNELIPFYAIAEHNQNGFGHIIGYIEKYEEVYKEADFDIDAFNKLSKTQKNKFLIKFSNNSFRDFDDMAVKFNKSFASKENNVSSGGALSGSSGGSIGGGVSSGNKVSSDTMASEGIYVPEKNEEPENSVVYSDIADVQWAEKAIVELSKNGIISGYGNGEFKPGNKVSRAEFVKMIISLLGLTGSPNESFFADVLSTSWYAPYVNAAAKEGIVMGGEDAVFNPEGSISREDAAVIIFRVLGKNNTFEKDVVFKDEETFSEYAAEAIKKLAGAGVINGMGDGTFMPKYTLTRAQAAVLIYAASEKVAK